MAAATERLLLYSSGATGATVTSAPLLLPRPPLQLLLPWLRMVVLRRTAASAACDAAASASATTARFRRERMTVNLLRAWLQRLHLPQAAVDCVSPAAGRLWQLRLRQQPSGRVLSRWSSRSRAREEQPLGVASGGKGVDASAVAAAASAAGASSSASSAASGCRSRCWSRCGRWRRCRCRFGLCGLRSQ